MLEQFIQDSVKPGSLIITDKWYGYDELPLLGYEHESHNHSIGDFANTNKAELIWSVAKRHMRKLYGQRILTYQLEELCKEWMARANQPELFASPIAFLRFTMALRVSWVNPNRFTTLAIYYKYSLTILSANSIADFIVFSKS